MAADLTREIVIEAVLNDPYGGAIRLLGDAERFGFELRTLALSVGVDALASATISVRAPNSVDAQVAATRLARHPALQSVDVRIQSEHGLPRPRERFPMSHVSGGTTLK